MSITSTEARLLAVCRGASFPFGFPEFRDIYRLARANEVGALVAYHVRRPNFTAVGVHKSVTQAAEREHAIGVIQQGLLESELESILTALGNIESLVLKGPSLALRYYPTGARACRDIDIHIREADYERAKASLITLGYGVMADYDEAIQRRQGKDVAFIRSMPDGKSWSVELHWRLSEPGGPELDGETVWKRAVRVPFRGASFLTTSPEDTLLLLAFNLRKHRFAQLKTVCDIAFLLDRERAQLDWEMLHRRAHDAGVCRLVRQCLQLSSTMLGGKPADFPACSRSRGIRTNLLARLTTPDSVFTEARGNDRTKSITGLIPFFSLDNSMQSMHLAYDRLTLSAELASYYRSGATNVYRSRRQYWQDTAQRFLRAIQTLSSSR